MFYDRGNHYEFLSLVQELASPGEMRAAQNFDFEFKNVEKQYESYKRHQRQVEVCLSLPTGYEEVMLTIILRVTTTDTISE